MKVDKYKVKAIFHSEDGYEHLSVYYDNRGEPYSEGITIELDMEDGKSSFVYLGKREALGLAEVITKLYG